MDKHGGVKGTDKVFSLREGEYITEISGEYDTVVDSIEITTSKGRSQRFGGSGRCADYRYTAPEGYEIAGFFGRSGETIDAIGVVLRKRESGEVETFE